MHGENRFKAGAFSKDITPEKSLFLFGYPHAERFSRGTLDPLYASAVVMDNGITTLAWCIVDLIFVTKEITREVREKTSKLTGIPGKNICLTATHTHSGPATVEMISNRNDPAVPSVDVEYIKFLVETLSEVISRAHRNMTGCELAITAANACGIGGNRRLKEGAVDPEVPVIVIRKCADKKILALVTTYCMHPTVFHESSKLYSADFPGYTRKYIHKMFGKDTVYLYNTGPEGNQSPRHFIKACIPEEAKRLGYLLGERIVGAVRILKEKDFSILLSLLSASAEINLPVKKFTGMKDAEEKLKQARQTYERLKREKASRTKLRTAECDLFGAEENIALSQCVSGGKIEEVLTTILPAEITVFKIGEAYFVFLPGELFVEYSLELKRKSPVKTFVICLANGELQGYIVTPEAAKENGYEASNSLFPPQAGDIILKESLSLIKKIGTAHF